MKRPDCTHDPIAFPHHPIDYQGYEMFMCRKCQWPLSPKENAEIHAQKQWDALDTFGKTNTEEVVRKHAPTITTSTETGLPF